MAELVVLAVLLLGAAGVGLIVWLATRRPARAGVCRACLRALAPGARFCPGCGTAR